MCESELPARVCTIFEAILNSPKFFLCDCASGDEKQQEVAVNLVEPNLFL